MEIINSIDEIKSILREIKSSGKSTGLVPTMGFFHDGHLSLMKEAVRSCDYNVVSLFVNPIQFGQNEDLESYPRDLERDINAAKQNGIDLIFNPSVEEMYPNNYDTYVSVENLTKGLCGKRRPTHFRGVTTIVTKLFNIIQPDRAFFGQKDVQQSIVLKKMVQDLNMSIEIVVCPIIREQDGLAMSSRNVYLSKEERNEAPLLYKSLQNAKQMIENGEMSTTNILITLYNELSSLKTGSIDYIEVVDYQNLKPLDIINTKVLIALAVFFGKARLIDNIVVDV